MLCVFVREREKMFWEKVCYKILSKKYEKQICDMNKTDPQRLKYISRFSSTILCTQDIIAN